MFDRFRKTVRKPHPYRLNLTPLEARCARNVARRDGVG